MSTILALTGASTTNYNFQKEVAEAHRLIMKEETMHSDTGRFLIQQTRSFPTVNGDSRGTRRTSTKVTMDVDVSNKAGDGDITLPFILDLSVSAPVGRDSTEVDTMIDLVAAYVNSAKFRALLEEGELADA
jgi:hypothetical protein